MLKMKMVLALLTGLVVSLPTFAGAAEPWREPQDTAQAINKPDMYAWRLFVALNWPAKDGTREADPDAQFGADGRVVWESWISQDHVFPSTDQMQNGVTPRAWNTPPEDCRVENLRQLPIQQLIRLQQGGASPAVEPGFPGQQRVGNEVRMNRESRDFIADPNRPLWHIDGQEAFFASGDRLEFPVASKEIKAQWRRITETEKPRYHWALCRSVDDSEDQLWGLMALHITTKDLPNWFWATFEHVDNNTDLVKQQLGLEGWLTHSFDRFSCPGQPRNCNSAPMSGEAERLLGTSLRGTKWQHYRLRGTQVDFVTPEGEPTVLANSVIEQGFQTTSSCITCHALSTIGPRDQGLGGDANRLNFFKEFREDFVMGPVGTPDPGLFAQTRLESSTLPRRTFRQLDFVWSFMLAKRKPASN